MICPQDELTVVPFYKVWRRREGGRERGSSKALGSMWRGGVGGRREQQPRCGLALLVELERGAIGKVEGERSRAQWNARVSFDKWVGMVGWETDRQTEGER